MVLIGGALRFEQPLANMHARNELGCRRQRLATGQRQYVDYERIKDKQFQRSVGKRVWLGAVFQSDGKFGRHLPTLL